MPTRIKVYFSVLLVSFFSIPISSFVALVTLAWFRSDSPAERQFAYDSISLYEPPVWGMFFLLMAIVPPVIALLYHGKRNFVEKYKAKWREHEELMRKVSDFREAFYTGDVQACMEELRESRLYALVNLAGYTGGNKPEEMDGEKAKEYLDEVERWTAEVKSIEGEIKHAHDLAFEFGLQMPPLSYYLCPKPDDSAQNAAADYRAQKQRDREAAQAGLPKRGDYNDEGVDD